MKYKFLAFLAAMAGAIALWNAQPASADQDVAQAAPSPAASASPTPAPKPFQYGGFVDAGITSAQFFLKSGPAFTAAGLPTALANTNLASGSGTLSSPYIFDYNNNQVMLHNFNVQASYTGPIGGKIELSLGQDANIINSYPKNEMDNEFFNGVIPGQFITNGPGTDLTQGYLSLASGQFTLILGKFETLAGAEVIEAPSDMEFSRSILFGYAVPFTHTGARLTWAATSTLSVIVGANKGWDTTASWVAPYNGPTLAGQNDTSALTAEFGLAWNPSKAVSITAQGYTGQVEEAALVSPLATLATARPNKNLIDVVATWHFNPALTFTLNGDSGSQTNSTYTPFGGVPFLGTDTWSGLAGYANYAFNSQWSLTGRAEYLGDFGGLRTGQTMRWGEGTITLAYTPSPNVILRAEIRGDETSQLYFGYTTPTTVGLSRYNRSFGFETVVKWP